MKKSDLAAIKKNFPEHYDAIDELRNSRRVYFETSAFNYMLENIPQDTILNTRQYLESINKKWVTSPLALWEIMLTSDDDASDHLLFIAQSLFYPSLLAAPSELVVRYLRYAYPKNKINYSFLSNLPITEIWQNMTKDDRITFVYDKNELRHKTSLYRKVSKNLSRILSGETGSGDEIVDTIAYTTNTIFECLKNDGWKLPANKTLNKFVIIYVILLLILCADFDSVEVRSFWESKGLADAPTNIWISYVFEHYPEIFWCGPVLEMANMACHQYEINRRDRGIILDGMHMIYAPYCDLIISGDAAFTSFRNQNRHYWGRLFHTSEIEIKFIKTAVDPALS